MKDNCKECRKLKLERRLKEVIWNWSVIWFVCNNLKPNQINLYQINLSPFNNSKAINLLKYGGSKFAFSSFNPWLRSSIPFNMKIPQSSELDY